MMGPPTQIMIRYRGPSMQSHRFRAMLEEEGLSADFLHGPPIERRDISGMEDVVIPFVVKFGAAAGFAAAKAGVERAIAKWREGRRPGDVDVIEDGDDWRDPRGYR